MDFEFPNEIKDIKVSGPRILVQILEREEKTKSGIFLTSETVSRNAKGVVLLTGPGKFNEKTKNYTPCETQPLDVILYDAFQGKKITVNGKKFIVLDEPDAVICQIGKVVNNQLEIWADVQL